MAVVAHHPVIVELEGVAFRQLAVDEDVALAIYLQVVALVNLDATLVNRQVLQRQSDALALFRNPYRTVVVSCPAGIGIQRIEVAIDCISIDGDALHEVLVRLQGETSLLGEWNHAALIVHQEVFVGDSQLIGKLYRELALELHLIGILHIIWLLVRLAVKINDAVLDLQGLSRQTNAALHVVLAAVGRTADDVAIFARHVQDVVSTGSIHFFEVSALLQWVQHAHILLLSVLLQNLVADGINHLIVIIRLIALLVAEGVAGRIVEHHDVVKLHVAQSLHAAVIPVRPLHVALHVDQRQGVLGQRHGERGFRNARSIAYLAHEEIVAREETLFER